MKLVILGATGMVGKSVYPNPVSSNCVFVGIHSFILITYTIFLDSI